MAEKVWELSGPSALIVYLTFDSTYSGFISLNLAPKTAPGRLVEKSGPGFSVPLMGSWVAILGRPGLPLPRGHRGVPLLLCCFQILMCKNTLLGARDLKMNHIPLPLYASTLII